MSDKAIPVSAIDGRIREIDDELKEMEQRRWRLQIERESLANLRGLATDEPAVAHDEKGDAIPPPPEIRPKKITDLVREYVRNHPGVTATEVADELEGQVTGSAKNPRRNVYTTALNLVNRGDLRKDDQGGLFLAGEGGNGEVTQ